MAVGTVQKQPAEVKDFDITFESYFESLGGDVIEDADAEIVSGNTGGAGDLVLGPGAELPDQDIVSDGSTEVGRIKTWVGGGTSGQRYKVTVTATMTSGRIIENDVFVVVKEQ